jgi:hypothetical protein
MRRGSSEEPGGGVIWSKLGRRQYYRHHQTLHCFSFPCLCRSAMPLIGFSLCLPAMLWLVGGRAGWLLCSHFCFCFDWIMNIDMARVSGSFCLLRKHSDCSVGSPRWSGHSALRTPHSARRQRQEDINWILRSIFETCNSEPVTKQHSSPSPPPLTTAWSQITFLRVQRQISEFY